MKWLENPWLLSKAIMLKLKTTRNEGPWSLWRNYMLSASSKTFLFSVGSEGMPPHLLFPLDNFITWSKHTNDCSIFAVVCILLRSVVNSFPSFPLELHSFSDFLLCGALQLEHNASSGHMLQLRFVVQFNMENFGGRNFFDFRISSSEKILLCFSLMVSRFL